MGIDITHEIVRNLGGALMNDQFRMTEDQHKRAIEAIKVFFSEKRDEVLGDLAAMLVLDFIEKEFGSFYYNIGISDARHFLNEKLEDMYGLEK